MFDGLVLTDALFAYGDTNNDRHLTFKEIYTFYKDIIGFRPDLAERTAGNLILIGDEDEDGVLEWKGTVTRQKFCNNSFRGLWF